MKHPNRYISSQMQQVIRGRRVLSRQAAVAVKMLKNDPSFRRLMTEIVRHLIELAIRITVISVLNQYLRPGPAQVVQFRPKPVS